MKTIQCLTVVVMMTVTVYTASLGKDAVMVSTASSTKDDLLKDIHDAALHMVNLNKTLDLFVTKIGQGGGSTCVCNFFCLAKESLKKAAKEHRLHGERLISLLEGFNNQTGITHCPLNTTNEHELKEFLENIMSCVDHRMISHNHQCN